MNDEIAVLRGRVERLRVAAQDVPPDPEWAEQMARHITRVSRRLTSPAADLTAFGSVISSLGVRVQALTYESHPRLQVTATVNRVTLLPVVEATPESDGDLPLATAS